MNGYKVYILTLVVGIFTWVQVWQKLLDWIPAGIRDGLAYSILIAGIMSLLLGAIIAGICFCSARFLWFGKVVEFAVYMHDSSVPVCLSQLETKIFAYAEEAAKGKGDRPMGWTSGWLARPAKKVTELLLHWAPMGMFAAWGVFCLSIASIAGWAVFLAKPWSIWTLLYFFEAIGGSLFSWGSRDP
jgi:hypothetical protein